MAENCNATKMYSDEFDNGNLQKDCFGPVEI